jgi:nicotinate-nucleotide adenylyltransferase
MENELSYPKVIHALCGPIVAKKLFNVEDKKILDAIRYHTLGNVKMTLFDKIIYIADLISDERNYKGVEILREMSYNNIDMAIITSIDNTLNYLEGKRVQPDVIKLRDFLRSKQNGNT